MGVLSCDEIRSASNIYFVIVHGIQHIDGLKFVHRDDQTLRLGDILLIFETGHKPYSASPRMSNKETKKPSKSDD